MGNFPNSSKTSDKQTSSIYTTILAWYRQRLWIGDSSATKRGRERGPIVSLSVLATMSEDGVVACTSMLELAQWAATALDQEAVIDLTFFHQPVRQEAAETDSQLAIASTWFRRKGHILGSQVVTQMANFRRRLDKHQVLDNLGALLLPGAWGTSIESSHINQGSTSTPDSSSLSS